jgi:hypothetical protein
MTREPESARSTSIVAPSAPDVDIGRAPLERAVKKQTIASRP